MFKKRAAVFYRGKTRAASCLNSFKNIPQKACPSGPRTMVKIMKEEY